jgi:predicted ArsR family transcriptional regulator
VLELFGQRQQELLKLLRQNKAGLSKDELAAQLNITRTAVGQHLTALELDGYVRRGDARKTAGRPGQTYVLTSRGAEVFPRQYSWFSGVLLQAIRDERGSEGLSLWLRDIAETIAKSLAPRLDGKTGSARLGEVVRIMDELTFEAKAAETEDAPAIEASNCVYHELAVSHPEICQFDIALIARLTGQDVEHTECMVRGGGVCRFKLSGGAGAAAPSHQPDMTP